jgi:GST-like protein
MIELFTTAGVHGQKVLIVLEETGLPYVVRRLAAEAGAHPVFEAGAFGRAPSLHDPQGPDGLPIQLGESAAVAFYLARKARRFGPEGVRELAEFDNWAHAISSSLAAAFALHAFDRQNAAFETGLRRMLHVFEERMATRHFMIGERFTVIDALLYPHLTMDDLQGFPNLQRYRNRLGQRDGVRRGMTAPG